MGWKDAPLKTPRAAGPKWASAPLMSAVRAAPDERGVLHRAAVNAPTSAANFAKSIYEAVRHPVQTGKALKDVFVGGVQNALPESLQAASAAPQRGMASAVGGYFKDRYGGLENIKETLATDPVGLLADATIPLTLGGGAVVKSAQVAGKVKALAPVAQKAATVGKAIGAVGSAIDPINVTAKVAAPVLKYGGARAADVIGMFPQTGGESVRLAFTSGAKGGDAGQAFRENMRGAVPTSEVVDQAKQAVANIRSERGAAYRSGMADVSKDKTVLDMQSVVDELNTQAAKGDYKGQAIDPASAKVKQEVTDAVVEWWQLDPKEFHTPEGLDALKQKIGSILDTTEHGSRARTVVDGVYNSVKDAIVKQAPGYAKVMRDYEEASTALKEIERALSLGNKASADTALRKLQSLLRNNANANYGGRLESAAKLEGAGAPLLRNALAGQAMNSWTPRGIPLTSVGAAAAGFVTNPLSLVPIVAGSSPRLVGEASHAAGRVGNKLNKYGRPSITPTYEAGQNRRNALAR